MVEVVHGTRNHAHRDTEERRDSRPVGEQPTLYLANRDAKMHVLGRGREPIGAKRWRTFEVVIQVYQDNPGREHRGPIVSGDPVLQVRLAAPAKNDAHVDARICGKPAQDRLVKCALGGSGRSYAGFAGGQRSGNIGNRSRFSGRVLGIAASAMGSPASSNFRISKLRPAG